MAQEAGVNIAINTDAHAIDQLNYMEYWCEIRSKSLAEKRNGR